MSRNAPQPAQQSAPAAATAVQSAPPRPTEQLRGLLERMKGEMAKALPKHLTPDRLVRLALTVFGRDRKLQECDPQSAMVAVFQAAQLGLEIDPFLGHAYLVPRKGVVTLMIGYRGYLELARRSGQVSQFYAHVVHERDHFSYSYGTNLHLEHRPADGDPGRPVKVYAFLRLKDGTFDAEVLDWSKVLRLQAEHGAKGGPWKTHLEEMARKSAIRALAKRCPLSSEFARATTVDADYERDKPTLLDGLLPSPTPADRLADRLGGPGGDPAEVPIETRIISAEPLPDLNISDDEDAERRAIESEPSA